MTQPTPKRPPSQKKTYKSPQAGQALRTVIVSGCKTPKLDIKFSNLTKAFYYPNSPNIPRYSCTCIVDPSISIHKEFIKNMQAIEQREKVDSIIKNDTAKKEGEAFNTGLLLIKFQSKDKIPVFVIEGKNSPEEIELEDELAPNEKVIIMYDILRYTKKNTMEVEHGISFKATAIYYFPAQAEVKHGEG